MGKNSQRIREKMLFEAAKADRGENRIHPKECLLPTEFIQKIRQARLLIADFPCFGSGHVAYPSGYSVILPAENGGNRGHDIEHFYRGTEGNEAKTLMPSVVLWGDGSHWHTTVHEYLPGHGPGDFHHTHASLDDAYTDLLSYFFDASNSNFRTMVEAKRMEKEL